MYIASCQVSVISREILKIPSKLMVLAPSSTTPGSRSGAPMLIVEYSSRWFECCMATLIAVWLRESNWRHTFTLMHDSVNTDYSMTILQPADSHRTMEKSLCFFVWLICLRWPGNAIIMHSKLFDMISSIKYFDRQNSDMFISLAILADVPSSSYREGVQDNNWLLYLQVMSFIWFVVCSLSTAHFALRSRHVINVWRQVSTTP